MRPRIYVANLAAYKAGRLHGRWIDCDQAPEQIAAEIREMLSESPVAGAGEWRIDDAEGFGSWHVGEWESWETLAAVAEMLVAHGDALSAFVANEGTGYWSKRLDELKPATRVLLRLLGITERLRGPAHRGLLRPDVDVPVGGLHRRRELRP